MKRIYTIFAFAAIAAAFASCNKNEYAATSGRTLSINVGTETKTILRNGDDVCWSESDRLCIFNTEYNGFTFKTTPEYSGKAEAQFTCENWTGTPVFAVHSNTKNIGNNAYDGSVVTSNLNPDQQIYNKASYGKESALSVEKVTDNKDGSYSIDAMKNCFALLHFTLSIEGITDITVKGNNDEYIAGWVDVNYDNLVGGKSFWTVNTDKGGAKTITVKPTGNACRKKGDGTFAKNTDYYIALLPQTLSKGITLVLTKEDGSYATRVISSSITLERSKIKSFSKPLDQGLAFTKDDFELDFTTIGGDTFKYNNEGAASNLPKRTNAYIASGTDFWAASYTKYLFNGAVRYWNSSSIGYLNFAGGSYVRFPLISEYKLEKITSLKVVHAAERNYKITSAPAGTYADGVPVTGGEEKSLKKDSDPASFILTDEYDADKDYYVVCNSEAGIRFKLFYKYIGQE